MKNLFLIGLIIVLTAGIVGCVPNKFKFDSEFGSVGSKPGEFSNPTDMEMTPEEDLVVSDTGNNRFQILSSDGGSSKLVGGEYGTKGFQLQAVAGIGVSRVTGDIIVCDLKGNKLVRFDKNGAPKLKITEKVRSPLDAAFDKLGNIYVIMGKQPAVYKYDPIGKYLGAIGGTGNSAFVFPISIKIKDDFIYVADNASKRIVKMDMKGETVFQYVEKGEFEPMKGPSSMFIDDGGNLYVLDMGDVPLVVLAPDGKLISKIGSFGDSAGSFMYPKSIVAKSNGEVLVLDNNRNLVIKYKKAS